jgi:hypothetical protein
MSEECTYPHCECGGQSNTYGPTYTLIDKCDKPISQYTLDWLSRKWVEEEKQKAWRADQKRFLMILFVIISVFMAAFGLGFWMGAVLHV